MERTCIGCKHWWNGKKEICNPCLISESGRPNWVFDDYKIRRQKRRQEQREGTKAFSPPPVIAEKIEEAVNKEKP